MARRSPQDYLRIAEAALRWVLDQVRWDDGPWIPWQAVAAEPVEPPWDRDGMHSGIGGLAYLLLEVGLLRPWTLEEQDLADGIIARVQRAVPQHVDCSFFDGLTSSLGVLIALGAPGPESVVRRLRATAGPEGWPLQHSDDPRIAPGTPSNDLASGTAGVLLGATWGLRQEVTGSTELAEHAATVLSAAAEQEQVGVTWRMVPPRYFHGSLSEMPNLSHGVAGVATALALAGVELQRRDLVDLACDGAEHLISLRHTDGPGLTIPRSLRPGTDGDGGVAYGWCHGSAGTSLLFLALARAGVTDVGGRAPLAWHRSCLDAVRSSGLPARLHPGFWDNDGRCCGTVGVGDIFLDNWQRTAEPGDLDFALHLADTVLERAVRTGPHAYWQFLEAQAAEPLLPPGVGWLQGTAGIAAYLFRIGRIVRDGGSTHAARRMENWWALEQPR